MLSINTQALEVVHTALSKIFQWTMGLLVNLTLAFLLLLICVIFYAAYGPVGPAEPYVAVPNRPNKYIIAESGTFGFEESYVAIEVNLIEPTGWFEERRKENIVLIRTAEYISPYQMSFYWINKSELELKIKDDCRYIIAVNTHQYHKLPLVDAPNSILSFLNPGYQAQ